MSVSPYGNKSAGELIKLVFKSKAAKAFKKENGIEFKFNFKWSNKLFHQVLIVKDTWLGLRKFYFWIVVPRNFAHQPCWPILVINLTPFKNLLVVFVLFSFIRFFWTLRSLKSIGYKSVFMSNPMMLFYSLFKKTFSEDSQLFRTHTETIMLNTIRGLFVISCLGTAKLRILSWVFGSRSVFVNLRFDRVYLLLVIANSAWY